MPLSFGRSRNAPCGHCGVVTDNPTNNPLCISCTQHAAAERRAQRVVARRAVAAPSCGECKNGVIETGNNDLPCDCPLGDTALFNTVDFPGPVTGAVLKQRRPALRQLRDFKPKPVPPTPPAPKLPPPTPTRYDLIDDDWLNR